MEERGNKTIMCGVLFLDIVEYSKKPVAVQISLKDRFNTYLSAAIHDVPVADRIILDASDGMAINFLGSVDDVLRTALNLRENLLNEDPNLESRLLVRMGINFGPVRLVRDINGQPSIVGDGINVAQRVMGFADASQILVSRSYHDALLRVSPQYAGLFHYQGARTDKHVREHEVFAIGYPDDRVAHQATPEPVPANLASGTLASLPERAKAAWHAAASWLDVLIADQTTRFRQAGARQRAMYAGIAAIPLLLLIALVVKLASLGEPPVQPVDSQAASGVQPSLSLRFSADIGALPEQTPAAPSEPQSAKTSQYDPWQGVRVAPENQANKSSKEGTGQKSTETIDVEAVGAKLNEFVQNITKRLAPPPNASASSADATVIVDCTDGASVLIDGQKRGVISPGGLTITLPPGKHLIGINDMTRGSIYSQEVVLEGGKTMTIKPSFCL